MSDPLAVYLEDHIAGAKSAIELLTAIRDRYPTDSLSEFAKNILGEIEADEKVLARLLDKVGGGGEIKKAGAWIAEKFSRFKFEHDVSDGLGTFEAMEFLTLGIQGKLALWRALKVIQSNDERLDDLDFQGLIVRAESQWKLAEEQRLDAARRTFGFRHQ